MDHVFEEIAQGVYVARAPQGFFGVEVGARMTVLNLDGQLLVHSPLALDPASTQPLGTLRWVLAPNLFHHLYVGPWIDAGAEAWAAPGLMKKRPDLSFQGEIEGHMQPFGDDVELFPLRCLPITNEVVVLHKPSRTLIVTDLVFNFSPSAPLWTRISMRCLCGYPGCKTTLLERFNMRREQGREEIANLLTADFDRVIMAHGEIIETGGKAALREAFSWLNIPKALPSSLH